MLPASNGLLTISGVDPTTGAIEEVGAISERRRGLLSLRGDGNPAALIRPWLEIDDRPVSLDGTFHCDLLAHCWPRLESNVAGVQLHLTAVCPPGWRGFVLRAALRASRQVRVRFSFALSVREALLTIASRRPIGRGLFCDVDPGQRSALYEVLGDGDLLALAIASDEVAGLARLEVDGEPEFPETGACIEWPNGGADPVRLRFVYDCDLEPGAGHEFHLLGALAPERDGARATLAAMRRRTPARLFAEADQEARRLAARLPQLPGSADAALGQRYQYNALLCQQLSGAEAIDTGALVPLLSSSPHSDRCATVGVAELLLWALPVVTWIDPPRARRLLLALCERYRQPAASHYLDGGVLEPGFALDAHCAVPIALSRYVTTTGDRDLLQLPVVLGALDDVRRILHERRHRDHALYATELLPCGLPAPAPYVTYSNVLAWRACVDLGWIGAESRHYDHAIAEEIQRAVHDKLVDRTSGDFVLAANLEGELIHGDDPVGSLFWLPALGFCPRSAPVFVRTVATLWSDRNPSWLPGRFGGFALPAAPQLAAGAVLGPALFGDRAHQALQILAEAPLDGGLLGAGYDPVSGEARVGRHRATLAGLLAWCLAESRVLYE